MAFRAQEHAGFSKTRPDSILPTVEPEPLESKYYAPRPPYDDSTSSANLEEFVSNAVWCRTNVAESWTTANIELDVHLGSGQVAYPFTITHAHFRDRYERLGFSDPFLRTLRAKRPLFEYRLQYGTGSSSGRREPTVLEIAVSNYENDDFFGIFRFDVARKQIRGLVFLKSDDHINTKPIGVDSFQRFLDERKEFLTENPLMVINALLEFIQRRGHDFVYWRVALYILEGKMGVSRKKDFLKRLGYPAASADYKLLNDDLASIGKEIADSELSASTICFLAQKFGQLLRICEAHDERLAGGLAADDGIPSEQQQQVHGVIARCELYIQHMKMCHHVLQDLKSVLYNLISQRESQTMIIFTAVTIIFVPPTFVSSVFSAGIFDFHAGDGQDAKTVSRFWPVYLITTVLMTAVTMALLAIWRYWATDWANKREGAQSASAPSREWWPPEEVLLRLEQAKHSKGPAPVNRFAFSTSKL
jgi:Mg2+ and Co2+ transporter CorA